MNSASKDSVRTPKFILKWIKQRFGSKIYDPVPFRKHFDPSQHKDALTTDWGQVSFANIPFSQAQKFVKKAHEEWKKRKTIIVLCKIHVLGSTYFQQYKGCEIMFFPKVVIFPPHNTAPRFRVCLLIYRAGKRSTKYSFFN